MGIVEIMGGLAALFALMLIVLPTLRVARGYLPVRGAAGLWISGAGFALLAAAALVLDGDAASPAILVGVTLAVVGNIVQRRATRPER